jgi:hypothetical protein
MITSFYPLDVSLQWGSPCIDAGDPDSPLDPDGTRADIGAFYFPHELWSPPSENQVLFPILIGSPYPNPSNGTIAFQYSSPTEDFLRVSILDVAGRTFYNDILLLSGHSSGSYQINASTFPAGMYFLRIRTGNRYATYRVALVK